MTRVAETTSTAEQSTETNAVTIRTKRYRRKWSPFGIATLVIAVVIVLLVVYPGGAMGARLASAFTSHSLANVFGASWFPGMIRDTVVVVGLSAIISVVIAAVLAWINERTDARFRFSGVLPLVPLFIPSIAVGIGWVVLGDPTVGFLNGILKVILAPFHWSPTVDIYSYGGMIFLYVLCLVPYAYLPISAGFRNLDPSLEEASRTSGAGPWRTLRTVSLPAIAPALIAGFVLVLIVGLSLYSIPVVIEDRPQIDIISVRIINAIRASYPPAYDVAILLSAVLLVVLVIVWLIQKRINRGGRFALSGARSASSAITRLGKGRWIFRLLIVIYGLLSTVLPLAALIVVSFQSYWHADVFVGPWGLLNYKQILFSDPIAVTAVKNSLFLGIVGGAITVLVAAVLVLYARNKRDRVGRIADTVSKIPAAVPHAVLAVAFIFAFGGPPFYLGGTLLILGLAYFVTYLPYVSIAIEPSILAIHPSLEEASVMSGAGPGRTFRKIILPMAIPGVFAAWALVFVRVISDLEVSVLLGTGGTPVVGFVMLDVYDQGSVGIVATLALFMTIITAVVILIMLRLGQPRWRRSRPSKATRRVKPAR